MQVTRSLYGSVPQLAARGLLISQTGNRWASTDSTTAPLKGCAAMKTFEVYRYNPEEPEDKPRMQRYNVNWWNPDKYLGPAALLQSYRRIIGSRDDSSKERLDKARDPFGAFKCHTVLNCTKTCQKHLNPAMGISKLAFQIGARAANPLQLQIERGIHTSAHLGGPRFREIRRHKMIKHKRRKRIDRDWFQYQKRHLKKKQKTEEEFRAEMRELRSQLADFDSMSYVKDIMKRAQREWETHLAPSGRKKYPHWSQSTTLEDLYELEHSTYIDKRYGLPTPEDKAKIAHLSEDYLRRYSLANITKPKSLEDGRDDDGKSKSGDSSG